jgi:hypothetical protein
MSDVLVWSDRLLIGEGTLLLCRRGRGDHNIRGRAALGWRGEKARVEGSPLELVCGGIVDDEDDGPEDDQRQPTHHKLLLHLSLVH